MNITELSPEDVSIAAAVIGAVVGVSLGTILTFFISEMARIREARRRIVGASKNPG